MTPRLSFHPAAVRDIAAAARWYEDQVSGLGSDFMSALDSVLAAVMESPLRFPATSVSRRRALLGRFPYALIFEMLDIDAVRVIACHHHRQSPHRWRVRERPGTYAPLRNTLAPIHFTA
jgi:plasmid stabilization system protein ParE